MTMRTGLPPWSKYVRPRGVKKSACSRPVAPLSTSSEDRPPHSLALPFGHGPPSALGGASSAELWELLGLGVVISTVPLLLWSRVLQRMPASLVAGHRAGAQVETAVTATSRRLRERRAHARSERPQRASRARDGPLRPRRARHRGHRRRPRQGFERRRRARTRRHARARGALRRHAAGRTAHRG